MLREHCVPREHLLCPEEGVQKPEAGMASPHSHWDAGKLVKFPITTCTELPQGPAPSAEKQMNVQTTGGISHWNYHIYFP